MRPDPDTPEAWLAYAHSDLALAAAIIPGVMRENLCFHAQQAAEKSLKAVLIDRQVDYPKTHSIKLLIELLPADIERPQALLDAVVLTEYASFVIRVRSSQSLKRNISNCWPWPLV